MLRSLRCAVYLYMTIKNYYNLFKLSEKLKHESMVCGGFFGCCIF